MPKKKAAGIARWLKKKANDKLKDDGILEMAMHTELWFPSVIWSSVAKLNQ